MRVQRLEGVGKPLYVVADIGRERLAGPFATPFAARLWIVQKVEAGLTPAKLEVWRQVSALLPAATDLGLELGLISLVGRGASLERLGKFLPKPARVDRKMLAAGDVR